MDASKEESYSRILNSYKNRNQRVIIITKADFVYTAQIIEVFSDSFTFLDKFGNEVILTFAEIKSLGGS
jgi:hypothetical protein